jgi:hypothetical protein
MLQQSIWRCIVLQSWSVLWMHWRQNTMMSDQTISLCTGVDAWMMHVSFRHNTHNENLTAKFDDTRPDILDNTFSWVFSFIRIAWFRSKRLIIWRRPWCIYTLCMIYFFLLCDPKREWPKTCTPYESLYRLVYAGLQGSLVLWPICKVIKATRPVLIRRTTADYDHLPHLTKKAY